MSSVNPRLLLVDGRPCHALVVDDVEINRRVLEIVLNEAGAVVSHAENGQVACEAFARGDFDIVLMDIQMPIVDGLTATRVIRALEVENSWQRTPIIVVSAHSTLRDVEASTAAGADLHLTKPVNLTALLSAVRDALDGWSGRFGAQISFYYR